MITTKAAVFQLVVTLVAAADFAQLWSNVGKNTAVTEWKYGGHKAVNEWSVEPQTAGWEHPRAWGSAAEPWREEPQASGNDVESPREEPKAWGNDVESPREEPKVWGNVESRREEPQAWGNDVESRREKPQAWGNDVESPREEPKAWEEQNSSRGEEHQPQEWNVFRQPFSKRTDDYEEYLKFKDFLRMKANLEWGKRSYPNWPARD